jgi:hypothetical protein
MNLVERPAIGMFLVNAHEEMLVDRLRIALALLLRRKVPMRIKAMGVSCHQP